MLHTFVLQSRVAPKYYLCLSLLILLSACSNPIIKSQVSNCGPVEGGRILIVQGDGTGNPIPVVENTQQLTQGSQFVTTLQVGERVRLILEQGQATLIETRTCEQGWIPSATVRKIE